ncbi:hypothetical protein WKH16_17600 [Pantoea agglomerans]|uniref:ATP-grasp domain-containing protein n=1 Tax=Enterobacter agglomerans TaxID=549 RepID=UPI003C7E135F
MMTIALVTDAESLANDYDMPLLVEACEKAGIKAEVVRWDDEEIRWEDFTSVILRSPWSYVERLKDFISWAEKVSAITDLYNPLPVIKWGLNKKYLLDLRDAGLSIVPTEVIRAGEQEITSLVSDFIDKQNSAAEIVIKPMVGAYSRGVRRFRVADKESAASYIHEQHSLGNNVLLQPYLTSIDTSGETDLVFFNGVYSHAIRKSALLQQDGTVREPLQEFRKARQPTEDELHLAGAAVKAVEKIFRLQNPLLYARIDLILDDDSQPVILEMEICEPSLNLPFSSGSAERFAEAIKQRTG